MRAEVEGHAVSVGNTRMMELQGHSINGVNPVVERLQSEAKTAMLVSIDGSVRGVIAVADTVKEGSAEAIDELHRMGLKIAMITGDNRKTAEAIATQVGIDIVLAEVLPEGKADEIKKLQTMAEKGQSKSRKGNKALWSPWSVTASTTLLPSPRLMWVLPSVPARMSPWLPRQ